MFESLLKSMLPADFDMSSYIQKATIFMAQTDENNALLKRILSILDSQTVVASSVTGTPPASAPASVAVTEVTGNAANVTEPVDGNPYPTGPWGAV